MSALTPPPADREYREATLAAIEARVRTDGPRQARPHPERARQFMPFAALKGYHELAHEQELEHAGRYEGW